MLIALTNTNTPKMKFKLATLLFIFSITVVFSKQHADFKGQTININSKDGLPIKADIYKIGTKQAPVILLFHQAGYSRGEYREIAPKLNALGFNCIAIDQRSGKEVNNIKNYTYLAAKKQGKSTTFPDAYQDLEATLAYTKKHFPSSKIMVWGSSYSADLVFILASKNRDDIAAVIAFSPGEYFSFEQKRIASYAKDLNCPVWITSAKNEHESWKRIYEKLPVATKSSYLPKTKGNHGSKALWSTYATHTGYWLSLNKFLKSI